MLVVGHMNPEEETLDELLVLLELLAVELELLELLLELELLELLLAVLVLPVLSDPEAVDADESVDVSAETVSCAAAACC